MPPKSGGPAVPPKTGPAKSPPAPAPASPLKAGKPSQLSAPPTTNYQQVIIAEFIAAELLVAATPIARKNSPGLSPYVPRDIVMLVSLGLVYLILELIASGSRGTGRVAAWFGAIILLAVGLNGAANIAKVLAVLSGGTGRPRPGGTTTIAAQVTPLQAFLQNVPGISTLAAQGNGGPATGRTPAAFVQEAGKFIGSPYVWGAAGPGAFDCSGLVQYALQQMGLANVPRTSEAQWGWVHRVPRSSLQAGDLIFEQWPGEVSPGHVAIYAGNGWIIQAPAPGQNVERSRWSPAIVHSQGGQIVGYGRVPGLDYGTFMTA